MNQNGTADIMSQPELETPIGATEITEDGTTVTNNIDPSLSPGVRQ